QPLGLGGTAYSAVSVLLLLQFNQQQIGTSVGGAIGNQRLQLLARAPGEGSSQRGPRQQQTAFRMRAGGMDEMLRQLDAVQHVSLIAEIGFGNVRMRRGGPALLQHGTRLAVGPSCLQPRGIGEDGGRETMVSLERL